MTTPKAEDVKRGIAVIWENLQCPICLDLMNAPVSTRCDHQFCKFCMMKLLERSKGKETSCPVCKMKVTKRSLQESPGFQRLVEGLQNLVQSYEFDTCTNYFTGVPQWRKETSIETESGDQQASEENNSSEHLLMEKAKSGSSTAAAKDAFANLMGLADSCTVNSEQDCSHSGHGDLPQDSGKNPIEFEDVPSRGEVRKSNLLTCNDGSPDCVTNIPKRRSTRRSKKVGLEPDRIVDKRQKKSVEKVAEWLLKISPSSDAQTQDKNRLLPVSCERVSERQNVCSSFSTEVNVKIHEKDKVRPSAEVPGRGLEEQVFGAVYKRERRSSKIKVTRGFTPEREIVADPDPLNSEEEEEIKTSVLKRKRDCMLNPADLMKRSKFDDKGERVVEDCKQNEEPEESVICNIENKVDNIAEFNVDAPLECGEEKERLVGISVEDICYEKVKNMEESPVFEVPLKRPGKRTKPKMQEVWQDLDCDFREKENCGNRPSRKRQINRNNCESSKDGHLEETKNVKCTKTLTLVSATENENDAVIKQSSKPKLVEAEINIENYPSSSEPQSPDARRRRSLRLQAFTAVVQSTRRSKLSTQGLSKPADGSKENKPSQSTCFNQPEMDGADANKDNVDAGEDNANAGQHQSGKNGCVCENAFEEIEIMRSNEETAAFTYVPEGDVPEHNSLVSVVQDTAESDRQKIQCFSMAERSQSPVVAVLPESCLPEKPQESASIGVVSPSGVQPLTTDALISAGEHGCMEEGGDLNDTELDTELLMKTFKGTKRKSFYLGSPKPSHVESQHKGLDKQEETQLQEQIPVISDPRSVLENIPKNIDLPPNHYEPESSEKPCKRTQSSFGNADAASVRKSQEDASLKNSGDNASSGLSPNRVARSQDRGNSGSPNSCQLLFTSASQEQPHICHSKILRNEPSPKSGTRQSRFVQSETQENYLHARSSSDINKSPGGIPNCEVHTNDLESSITPDGLLLEGTRPDVSHLTEPVASHSLDKMERKDLEIHSQPCARKKRKAQRLESSESELSAEDEDLPSIAQIFKSHCSPLTSGCKKGHSNKDNHQLQEAKPELHSQSQDVCPPSEPAPGAQPSQRSQCVSPSQNEQYTENVKASMVETAVQPQTDCRDEWITSSQGSVDLFGTPEESEAVDGISTNVALSRDSSQYSSEIINTQQKEEIQQELRRLERMMALVSEALQKKEGESGVPAPKDGPTYSEQHSAADLNETGRCCPGNPTDMQSDPDSGKDRVCVHPSSKAPDNLETSQYQAPLTRGQAKAAGQRARRNHQKTPNSKRQSLQKLEAGSEVKGDCITKDITTDPVEGKDMNEAERKTSREGRLGINNTAGKMELVASGLSASELAMVKKFARKMDGSLSKEVAASTTHVIIKTDEDLVCERTLKYFQGIASRKWVVSYLWIFECFKQGQILDEVQFEVRGDVVNGRNHSGPLKSRTTADDLLMKGYEICFQGSFTGMTTDQMEAMVEMCGAKVMKDPLMFSKHGNCQLVVVQPGFDDSQSYYRALQKKATVVTRGWLLDTIATYTTQNPEDYKP